MRKLLVSMMAMVLTVLMVGPALATNVPVYFDAGTTNYITEVVDYPTTGGTMPGMTVQVSFANNTSETEPWISTGTVSGAATGSGWSLAQSGDTFPDSSLDNYWQLTNTGNLAISEIRIDAMAGNVVFDTTDNQGVLFTGTPGSELGYDFTLNPDYPSNFNISEISATWMRWQSRVAAQWETYTGTWTLISAIMASSQGVLWNFSLIRIRTPQEIFSGSSARHLPAAGFRPSGPGGLQEDQQGVSGYFPLAGDHSRDRAPE
jgi:hypothetical protein